MKIEISKKHIVKPAKQVKASGQFSDCLLCGKPLLYQNNTQMRSCAVCGDMKPSNCVCEDGHFVCDACHTAGLDVFFVPFLLQSTEKDPQKLMEQVMALPRVHMHGPEHHRLSLVDGQPTLLYQGKAVTPVELMPASEFYKQKTSSGMPYSGNAVLQGCDWVAFQCLWPCDFACAGKPCQFCFSGGQFEALARRHKPMPFIPSPQDVSEVVLYAVEHDGVSSMQLTGGSTFKAETEEKYIIGYLRGMEESGARAALKNELLLYITPPERQDVIDRYFEMGASRIACSLEVWDDKLGESVTPGKRSYITKPRYLDALTYIAEKHGPGKAFSNFIIGLEPFETLKEGATYLAERA